MGDVNYYLKKKEEATGKSLIYLKYKYQGRVLVFSFGQTINPKLWNKDKQRVKNNSTTTADGQHSLNDLLDTLETVLLKAYHEEIKNGIPEPAFLKYKLIQYMNRQGTEEEDSSFYGLLERFIRGEIKHKGREKEKSTLKTYKTALHHLKAFELSERYPISFETIGLNFYYKYISYFKKQGLSPNTVAKQIQIIKTVMNEALDLGFTKNIEHKNKKFTASWDDADTVYLTEKELMDLFNHDLSDNKRLERVRDLFIFGAFTGLRFSDYTNVKPENIISMDGEQFVKINTQKTGEQVVIPCHHVVIQIFEKYQNNPNKLPKAVSNQKFNDFIKEACRAAGLTEKGRLLTQPDKELCDCVSSHTARRSFATNLYLDGYPTLDLMRITGHRTERSFLRYIRVSKLDAARKLSAHMKKRWSEKLLRVA